MKMIIVLLLFASLSGCTATNSIHSSADEYSATLSPIPEIYTEKDNGEKNANAITLTEKTSNSKNILFPCFSR